MKSPSPSQAITLYNQGLEYAKNGQLDLAQNALETARLKNPKHLNSVVVLGKIYFARHRPFKAWRTWHDALEIDPQDSTAKACLYSLRRQMIKGVFLMVLALMMLYFGVSLNRVDFKKFSSSRSSQAISLGEEVKNLEQKMEHLEQEIQRISLQNERLEGILMRLEARLQEPVNAKPDTKLKPHSLKK